MAQTRVSVCMIVKNEEKDLAKAIKSVHDKKNVLEVIVVDTGSTDKTKEVALQFPKVKLFNFKWINDFSAARNFSISKAKGNWIFYMDADEEFIGEFPDEIKPAIYNFKIKNLADDGSFVYSVCSRFAPRDKDVYFINPVHEIWGDPKQKYGILMFAWGEISHTGYLTQARTDKNKSERNLKMLEEDYKNKPTVQKCYYLGQELFIVRELERVFELSKEGIALIDTKNALDLTFEPLLYHLYLSAILELKREELIPEFEEKYLHKSEHPECFTALIQYYLSKGNEEKAIKYCFEAIKMRNATLMPAKYNENIITYIPFLIIAQHYEQKQNPLMACIFLEHAHMNGCMDPNVIGKIYQFLPKYKEPAKLEYYLKHLYNATKDNNILKELTNVLLNSQDKVKWEEAVNIMNQISTPEELEYFKGKLKENGKEDLANKVILKTKVQTKKLPLANSAEDKVSVIIPTMMIPDKAYMEYNLEQLLNNNGVKEIIIIDNSSENKFSKEFSNYLEDSNSKIRLYNMNKNIGVNPAWNLGVEVASAPYYLILNDDCMVRSNIIDSCVNILTNDQTAGLVVVETKKEDIKRYINTEVSSVEDEYVIHGGQNVSPYGWFLFGRVSEWKPIPSELNLFYGDNLIHYNVFKSGKMPYRLVSNYINHEVSKTVTAVNGELNNPNSKYNELLRTEGEAFRKYIGM